MKCPVCESENNHVVDSRQKGKIRRRSYLCHTCWTRFYTSERVTNWNSRKHKQEDKHDEH